MRRTTRAQSLMTHSSNGVALLPETPLAVRSQKGGVDKGDCFSSKEAGQRRITLRGASAEPGSSVVVLPLRDGSVLDFDPSAVDGTELKRELGGESHRQMVVEQVQTLQRQLSALLQDMEQ